MAINVADQFQYLGKKSLDARVQYATLAAMKAVTDANIYEGCEAYCAETDKYYKFLSTNTVDQYTGKWREREDSAGHIIEDSEGTALTQRDTLQFGEGFKAEDDDTNEKTVISPDVMPSGDMDEVISPKPVVINRGITVSNPNLFDNPWFTVNQRNKTSSTTGGYTVDRWIGRGTTEISISDNIVTLVNNRSDGSSWFGQHFKSEDFTGLIGKTFTYSFMLSSGEIKSWTFTLTSTTSQSPDFELDTGTVYLRTEWSQEGKISLLLWLRNLNDTVSIKAMKLELGSVSTLAMDTAPNYVTELLKCQGYFVRVKTNNVYGVLSLVGRVASTSDARLPIILPTTMRTSPTITFSGSVMLHNDTTNTNITTISLGQNTFTSFSGNFGVIKITPTSGTLTVGDMIELFTNNDANAHIDLSADL